MTREPTSLLRETDEEARIAARRLVRSARHVPLAVLDPETGFPSVSRVLLGLDLDCTPVILVSALAGHARGLKADPRCSFLAGEPGKGDPLAHARITVFCQAEPVARGGASHQRLRTRFLRRHPKAALYVDFPDFSFLRLVPIRAAMNGGFGKAYTMDGEDLVLAPPHDESGWLALEESIMIRYQDASRLASASGASETSNCRMSGIDQAGFDIVCGNRGFRYEFDSPCPTPQAAEDYVRTIHDAV
ncbi:pyridoxamine 5'-phosphate oxidase family protein [Rhizobium sp. CSW-27]|uniref:HugZ family pyridoxamine 5'-phosphate oxidase n=1 Tax=Rhizobium sp. CSW-27 TaxID=2839985 RepID=UPI001C026010|nr:pyridoxamine 5'-phosphate oxidase family protein [Rhizobium sp. CSW-27]MBT9369574.1 pyridoxamine 5'-phosphate oxidase family protein [Rhizobium sp. CSW-27]